MKNNQNTDKNKKKNIINVSCCLSDVMLANVNVRDMLALQLAHVS